MHFLLIMKQAEIRKLWIWLISCYGLIENKMRDELGYKEAFDETFHEIDNDKLSENGVMADEDHEYTASCI